ncbi:hypothetical protein MMC25_008180 [Agyrium rufum]|nr:hypothetical protein [Agyrium rufum]
MKSKPSVVRDLEATAISLRAITYHIHTNGSILRRLRSELSDLVGLKSMSLRELEQLPYLTAVIMEGLRLNLGLATRLARIAPDRDLHYDKWTIPAGSPVGMTIFLMHLDEHVYPRPEEFDPDRWLENALIRKADKIFAPFSQGTGNCIGMHIAWAELYLTIAMLVSRFDREMAGTEAVDIECGSDQFVPGQKRDKGLNVFVKRNTLWQ